MPNFQIDAYNNQRSQITVLKMTITNDIMKHKIYISLFSHE